MKLLRLLSLVAIGWIPICALAQETMLYLVEDETVVFTNLPADGARPVPGWKPATGKAASGSKPMPDTVFDPFIEQVAREHQLAPELIKAVALVESGFNPRAVSHAGASGLMQLMPGTAKDYGVTNVMDPLQNLRAGAAHLRRLLDLYDGDLTLALAAYNAGEGTVKRHNGVPDYGETVSYVRKVHEKLGRTPRGLPEGRRPTRPVTFKILADGSVLLSNALPKKQ